jgi:hypothetical protein
VVVEIRIADGSTHLKGTTKEQTRKTKDKNPNIDVDAHIKDV